MGAGGGLAPRPRLRCCSLAALRRPAPSLVRAAACRGSERGRRACTTRQGLLFSAWFPPPPLSASPFWVPALLSELPFPRPSFLFPGLLPQPTSSQASPSLGPVLLLASLLSLRPPPSSRPLFPPFLLYHTLFLAWPPFPWRLPLVGGSCCQCSFTWSSFLWPVIGVAQPAEVWSDADTVGQPVAICRVVSRFLPVCICLLIIPT